ncbi:MAG TPA: IS200/IS605 family transposase [Thermoguttaceae bacterium]|nr:IS200/IS605 family transposase [Thermoguttaceae bacterium]
MPQSFICLNCHMVFSTKNRVPLINADLTPRLYGYLGGIVDGMGGKLVAAGGMPDHVHLIVSLGKTMSTADTVRTIKSNSSGWIHETFAKMDRFAWQTGYGAFAVSYSDLDRVKKYIADQEEHHRARTFREEFLALLERHSIEYDERYIWD